MPVESAVSKSRQRALLLCAVAVVLAVKLWRKLHPGPGGSPLNWRLAMANWQRAGFSPEAVVAILLFLAFSFYWEAAAVNAAEAQTSESGWSRGIHLVLVSVSQALLLLPVPYLRAGFFPASQAVSITGLILEAAFLLFAVWARRNLGQNWSGAVAITANQQLVRSGPYQFVRHPIYSGLLGAYLGMVLVWNGELHAILGFIIICLAYWRKIRLEERYLNNQFGPAYADYRSSTRAIIPGVW